MPCIPDISQLRQVSRFFVSRTVLADEPTSVRILKLSYARDDKNRPGNPEALSDKSGIQSFVQRLVYLPGPESHDHLWT